MSVIGLILYFCQLAFVGLILWFVVEQLTAMPPAVRRIAQLLLALILILAALQAAISGATYQPLTPGLLTK